MNNPFKPTAPKVDANMERLPEMQHKRSPYSHPSQNKAKKKHVVLNIGYGFGIALVATSFPNHNIRYSDPVLFLSDVTHTCDSTRASPKPYSLLTFAGHPVGIFI